MDRPGFEPDLHSVVYSIIAVAVQVRTGEFFFMLRETGSTSASKTAALVLKCVGYVNDTFAFTVLQETNVLMLYNYTNTFKNADCANDNINNKHIPVST